MKNLQAAVGLLLLLICLPITFYLQYYTLTKIDASELVMFLFWVNLPLLILANVVAKLVTK